MDAVTWDERYAASEQVWSREPNGFVAGALADLPPGRAVDLACGEGRNALWLARRGWRVTAVDFSAVAVDRGRRAEASSPDGRIGAGIDWRVADVLQVDLPEVDLVVLAYLQLPADQRRAAVRRSWAALVPGGTFFVVAHDATNLIEGTGGPQDATVLYTAQDVLDDLAGEQFATVRAERVARAVQVDDEHGGVLDATAWDALVHLRRS